MIKKAINQTYYVTLMKTALHHGLIDYLIINTHIL